MFNVLRKKFGPWVIGIIISFIALVFIFEFGIVERTPRLGGSRAYVGKVNGEIISLSEFNRRLSQQLEFFKSLSGGKIDENLLKSLQIKESVFRELVNRKLMIQEAYRVGLVPSDAQVRNQITEMSYFQKDGQFDRKTYQQVLEANHYSPAVFEKMVRDDLILQNWRQHFHSLVGFSDQELKREFLANGDKRTFRYVLISPEGVQKRITLEDSEIQKALKDPGKLNIIRAQFEAKKNTEYKGKGFDSVSRELMKGLLASEKTPEIRTQSEKLADQIASVLNASSSSEQKANALLVGTGLKVQTSNPMSRSAFFIAGAGDVKDLEADAFALKSPIDGKAKKYFVPGGVLVALVTASEKPDLSKLDEKEREAVAGRILARKEQEIYTSWIKDLEARAKVQKNEQVLGENETEGV